MRNVTLWLRDGSLTLRTIARGLSDDPLHFLLLGARRLRVVKPPRTPRRPSLRLAYRWYLSDRPQEAAAVLRQLPRRRGVRGRLAARLEVGLGMRRSVPQDPARLRAHDLANIGALSEAIDAAPARSALKRRLMSERASLLPSHPATAAPFPDSAPRRVLFVLTNSLPYTHSGYTQRSHHVLTALAASGMTVDAVTRLGYPTTVGIPAAPATAVVDGIRYHRLSVARLPLSVTDRLAAQADLVERLAVRRDAQVLHCTTDYTNAVVTAEVARRLGLPWVYEMRGQLELTWIASRPSQVQLVAASSERVNLLRAREAELAAAATAVIVLSAVQRADLIARGVPAERITVVPNGVDDSLLTATLTPQEARSRLGLPTSGFWVGSVSSLVAYEGFDTLLRAVSACRSAGVDVRCALVGDGVSRPGLVALAAKLGLRDVSVFPGRVPAEQAPIWHQCLDVFAVPRQDQLVTRVVTPLKPIEAMAVGRPVVASDLPALAELVTIPQSGRCFPAGDADTLARVIRDFACDPAAGRAAAQAGRRFAAGRTWQNAAQTITSIYASGRQ